MPTVLRINGLRVVIYPNDHQPPHVHVKGPNGEAVFNINCPEGPVTLRENDGFSKAQLNDIEEPLNANLRHLCAEWRRIHD